MSTLQFHCSPRKQTKTQISYSTTRLTSMPLGLRRWSRIGSLISPLFSTPATNAMFVGIVCIPHGPHICGLYQLTSSSTARAAMLGGSGTHNALINIVGTKYDFDTLAQTLNDSSWSDDNMRKYFVKLENNLYMDPAQGEPLGHGYNGWLYTDNPPIDIVTDPKWYDPQLVDAATGIQGLFPIVPYADFNAIGNDFISGGGQLTLTKDPAHNRSSVRDFLVDTMKQTTKLNWSPSTMVTRILTCNAGSGAQAYGVTVAKGDNLLPAARKFAGKKKLTTQNIFARYEVIVSAGAYQTPHILMVCCSFN
jgi:choline dehydrogenase